MSMIFEKKSPIFPIKISIISGIGRLIRDPSWLGDLESQCVGNRMSCSRFSEILNCIVSGIGRLIRDPAWLGDLESHCVVTITMAYCLP